MGGKQQVWAIRAMMTAGQLSIGQFGAAMRLKRLMGPISPAVRETAYTAILKRLAANDALDVAQGSDEWQNRQRVVRAAFERHAPSLSALVRLYCESSRNVERVRRILRTACEALEAHWARVDSGEFRRSVGLTAFADDDSLLPLEEHGE